MATIVHMYVLAQHHVVYYVSGEMCTWCSHLHLLLLAIEVKSEIDTSWAAILVGLTLYCSTCLPAAVLYKLLLWHTQAHTQYVCTVLIYRCILWNTHALECAYNIHACLLTYALIHVLSMLTHTHTHTRTHTHAHARTHTQHQIYTGVHDQMFVRSLIKWE